MAKEHLLVPVLNEQNEYDEAAVAKARKQEQDRKDRPKAAEELVNILEIGGVSADRIKERLNEVLGELEGEARGQRAS